MVKYKVISSSELEIFETEVNSYLKEGWELKGNIEIYVSGVYPRFLQVLVKKEETNREVINE